MTVMRGSCLCGGVRFEVTGPSNGSSYCHCDNCRRAHAAGVVAWIGFPDGTHRFTAGEDLVSRYESDTRAIRSFCSRCGTQLLYVNPRWAGEVHVPVGVLDDPPDRLPSAHVYSQYSPEWSPIHDDLKRLGGASGEEPL